MIKVFDIEKGVLKPTPHCYAVSWLKAIMDQYPKDYMKIYAYLFYMTCPTEDNIYLNVIEDEKEDIIIRDLGITFSLDSQVITYAKERLEKLYETPSLRSFRAVKKMIDKISEYLDKAEIEDGKDGNASDISRYMDKIGSYRQTYKDAYNDLQEEQKNIVKGGTELAYDQKKKKF